MGRKRHYMINKEMKAKNDEINTFVAFMTADTKFEPFPHNCRAGLRTRIVIFDTIPKKYLCKKICDLDFWNEISGFIHCNYNYGHKVVDTTNGNVEIPDDVPVIHQSLDDSYIPIVAGDYFINSNYEVFRCYGWNNESGGAEIYFDFV